jgi:ribosomal RNA-processing protein 7
VLQASVDAYMTAFADQEASRARALTRQRAEPDEDGFVTVTRGGRMGPARLEEAQEKAELQKEKQKGKEDFYRFQMREKRKEKANELLKGFEEDRKKVEAMKMKRNKFRPN